ncbi:MAG: extracellular solute-binding protein, partial [Treponema sp.]|nr:extracellular solute-binding protein [Treponema sp.]
IHSESPAERSAIRLVSYMDLFFYNIDILEAADCDRPPKTRAEFIAAARAVAKNASGSPGREAVFPLALGLKAEDPLALRRDIYPWIWAGAGDSSGWKPLSDDGTLSRSALETAAFFGQLNGEGLLAPGTFEKTGAERLEEFASGKTAMMTASAEDIAYLRQSAQGLNFGVTAVPAAASPGKNRVGLSGIYAGISSGCALPDEAWAFLAFIAGRSRFLVEALLAVPGSFPGAFPGAFIADDPLYSKAWDIFEAADVVEYGAAGEEADGLIRESLLAAFAK